MLYEVGTAVHIVAAIPAGILAILQFISIIRYKALLSHLINGYLVVLLVLIFSKVVLRLFAWKDQYL
jgi:hypothetical protein